MIRRLSVVKSANGDKTSVATSVLRAVLPFSVGAKLPVRSC